MSIKMKSRSLGLRVSSMVFGLLCVAHIARLCARAEIIVGRHHLGQIPSFISIIGSGALSIWLAKLAGPWCVETKEAPPKL